MPAIRPTGYWTKSKRHRVAWALKQVGARRRDAQRRRQIAQWQSKLRRALDRALSRVDWEAWARRRAEAVVKEIAFKPSYDIDDLPKMNLGDVENLLTDLYVDAGKRAWVLEQAALGGSVALPFPAKQFDAAMAKTFADIDGITKTMQSRMQSIMRDTMNREESFGGFARALREEFSEFSRAKAEQIAVTEYARAASESTQLLYEAQGITLKVWNTVGDGFVCITCLDNEAEGPIDIKDEFGSGDRSPPAHPHCRCNIGAAE